MNSIGISVIVPVFNVEKYISRCLNSILNQTFKNFEIIIVNDGSTDNSLNKIQNFKDSRIKVINQTNKGVSAARNLGLAVASGEYITFIDADDSVSLNYFEVMMTNAKKYNADIVSIRDCIVDENEKYHYKKRKFKLYKDNVLNALYSFDDTNFLCCKLIKKSIFDNLDLKFPINKRYEDIGTLYRIFNYANTLVLADKGNYYYYMNTNSITHKKKLADIDDKLYFIKQIIKFNTFNKNHYSSLYVLVKLFGVLSDLYKTPASSNKNLYKHKIYKLCKSQLFSFYWFAAPKEEWIRALLMKTKFANIFLAWRHCKK